MTGMPEVDSGRASLGAALALGLWLGSGVGTLAAAGEDSFGDAVTSGQGHIALRYRYEFVDQDSFADDANASTLRVRLNYETGEWNAWSSFLEFDQVLEVGADNYNSAAGTSSPARDRYPVIADPNGSDLNQFYLQYAPNDDWRTRLGRQRILLDDQRFVGGVGWRQNEQTYDGISLRYDGFEDTSVFYTFVSNVNRIFGSDVAAGDNEQDTHLLNVSTRLSEAWKLVGFAYLIDNEDVPGFSSDTYGLRLTGDVALERGKLALSASYARQSDAGNAPADYDADYFRVEGVWSQGAFSAGAGFESLGSDKGQSFRTPLATLYIHNGWGDQFLATPAGGLEDLYIKAGYRHAQWNFEAVYHDFSAEAGGGDYASEIDLSAGRKFGKRYSILMRLASFEADSPAFVDTTKIWALFMANL